MTTTAPVRSTAHDSGATPAYAPRGELPFNLSVEECDLVQKVRGAGHRPHLEQPAAFAEVTRTVLSETIR